MSSRTKDHCNNVIGPVNIPFTGLEVREDEKTFSSTVIGLGRVTSAQIMGGFTYLLITIISIGNNDTNIINVIIYLEPKDWTQPFSVKAKPSKAPPKYSTMSFLSNSPVTNTSKSISSWNLIPSLIFSSMNFL